MQFNNDKANFNIIFSLVIAIFSIFMMKESYEMPKFGGAFYQSPGFLPLLLSLILFLTSIKIFQDYYKERTKNKDFKISRNIEQSRFNGFRKIFKNNPVLLRIFLIIALIVIYIFILLGSIPYTIATFIFLVSFMYLFRERINLIWLLLSAVIITVLVYYIFHGFFKIPLP